jgi:hypothetical protein
MCMILSTSCSSFRIIFQSSNLTQYLDKSGCHIHYLQRLPGPLQFLNLKVDIVRGGGDVHPVGRHVEVEAAQVLPHLPQVHPQSFYRLIKKILSREWCGS